MRRAVFYAYALAVLVLAVYPFEQTVGSGNDKINHVLAFIAFYGLAAWSHQRARITAIIIWGIAYGVLIELIQAFVPYRQCSLGDLAADAAGLMLGMIAWSLHRRWLRRNGLEPEQPTGLSAPIRAGPSTKGLNNRKG